jgi:uncharacterized protein YrrD
VPWRAVVSFGPDAVLVQAVESAASSKDFPEVQEVLDRGRALEGVALHTTEGQYLGRIDSFFFDEHTGEVAGYLVRGKRAGKEQDLFLPTPQRLDSGKDSAFVVPEDAMGLRPMDEPLGGVTAASGTRDREKQPV